MIVTCGNVIFGGSKVIT